MTWSVYLLARTSITVKQSKLMSSKALSTLPVNDLHLADIVGLYTLYTHVYSKA